MRRSWLILVGTAAVFVLVPLLWAHAEGDEPRVVVHKRAAGLKHYPCSQCHKAESSGEPKMPPRVPHNALRFKHMKYADDCYLCHDRSNMNNLRLFSKKSVPLDDSHLLCGQCHDHRHRDWKDGIHGKQVGSWRGARYRYTCADCHDPHSPKYKPTRTLPAPPRPKPGAKPGAKDD